MNKFISWVRREPIEASIIAAIIVILVAVTIPAVQERTNGAMQVTCRLYVDGVYRERNKTEWVEAVRMDGEKFILTTGPATLPTEYTLTPRPGEICECETRRGTICLMKE